MRKRWGLLFLVLLLSMGAFLLALRLFGTARPRISRETFGQLHAGMAIEEVEQLIGSPPGNYCTVPFLALNGAKDIWGEKGKGTTFWASNDGQIVIWFDDKKALTGASFEAYFPPPFLSRVLCPLGIPPF